MQSLQSSMSLSFSSPLEPYRAARLIFDLQTAAPLALPTPFLRKTEESITPPPRDLSPARATPEPLRDPRDRSGMIGESAVLQMALGRIARLAPGDLPVLVLGESGTGKELAARAIHRASARAHRPFVAVNCAALSETLILSDLFGHSKGAFTGADRDHKGVFETADGGTVFLDEIGDLPLSAQGLLLRVLQEGEVRSVGRTLARKVDVRVLAATHRDLASMVAERTFRQDLFYRLKVGSVTLPPLRERGEDVLLLAERFLGSRGRLSKEARSRLLAYDWPGNIRELQNILGVAVALAEGEVILPEHLELPEELPEELPKKLPHTYHAAVEAFRRGLIEKALVEAGGNQSAASQSLGLSRQSLSYLVRQLRIEISGSARGRAE